MPVYDYKCGSCETIFEVRSTFLEKEEGLNPVCPVCNGLKTHQILSGGMLIRTVNSSYSSSNSCCDPNSGSECCA